MADEIELKGRTYRIGTLDARKQLHIVRRIGPVIGSLEGQGSLISRVLNAIGELSDADTDYVIDACLAICMRKQDTGEGWSVIMRGGNLMFEDIGLVGMLQLTKATLEHNLSDFFPGSLATSGAEA